MEQLIVLILAVIVIAVILSAIVLPLVAVVISIRSRTKLNEKLSRFESAKLSGPELLQPAGDEPLAQNLYQLNLRLQRLEATLAAQGLFPDAKGGRPPVIEEPPGPTATIPQPAEPVASPAVGADTRPPVTAVASQSHALRAAQIESVIGRRLVGWAAVSLILFATAFFLKYAFDNRWIGELGRVGIGIALGIGLGVLGFKYHLRRWRIFSQILTAGGIVLLYLSNYAAFGYYHLVGQKAAFAYLAILIAEAAGMALLYQAPAIAIMALVGGFLTPLLLHSDTDQYQSFFVYIGLLDVGALALLKHWRGLSSVAYFGTQLLFWLWYNENYHPQKRSAVLLFQTAVFLIFLLAHLGRELIRRQRSTIEDLVLVIINPFVFFATSYEFLNATNHDWMGVFAIGMALLYAGAAKVLLRRNQYGGGVDQPEHQRSSTSFELLPLIGIALTFVTIAIPVQLHSNWITIAWAVEGVALLWAGLELRSLRLRIVSFTLFGLALGKLFLWDSPFNFRPIFIPVLNRYFLSSVVVIVCLLAASFLYERIGAKNQIIAPKLRLVMLLVAAVAFWFVMSVETQTFFAARAATEKLAEDAEHQRWLGQMALSVLWGAYAAALAATGFVRRSPSLRWASLVLFALTIIKAMLVDIAQLQQLYRIIVFFVLGFLLLLVAWAYHRAFHSRESSK